MGKASRDKGSRTERNLVKQLVALGYNAHRVDNKAGQLGSTDSYDVEIRSEDSSVTHKIEVKCKGNGFKGIYNYIEDYPEADAIVIKADNKPFLVIRQLKDGVL